MTYVRSQGFDGKPYIGEYLDEKTGYWLKGAAERSRYYNHSTFADLVITGVVGLRPRADDVIEVRPLLPRDTWDWFCLDGVKYEQLQTGNVRKIPLLLGYRLHVMLQSQGSQPARECGNPGTAVADDADFAKWVRSPHQPLHPRHGSIVV